MKTRAMLLCLAVSGAPVLGAQELHGVVRDSANAQPLAGAVLVLLDSSGRVVGRNITNERGAYRIVLDAAIRRVRVQRIGFRPRELPVPSVGPRGVELDVSMAAIPTLLEPVRVVDNPACPRRPDRAAAFALWEQAKDALLATVVAREANPPAVTRYTFDQRMDRDGRAVAQQSIRVDSATTGRPFSATAPAAQFVEHGFVADSAGIEIFNGPDADVLLDDAFTAAYCFRLAGSDPARAGQVGIVFAPARSRRGRIDLDGAAWIDTASRSLVDVTWRYTGVSTQFARYDPGGHVWFRAMPNGSTVIDRWFIRLPQAVAPSTDHTGFGASRSTRPPEIHQQGGELADAHWPDGQAWHASLGALAGTVTRGGLPAPGQHVQLLDTPYTAETDSAGHFRIQNLVPGPYRVGFTVEALAPLGLALASDAQFEASRDSVSSVTIEALTADDFVASVCGADAFAPENTVVVARIVASDGTPVRQAGVRVRSVGDDGSLRLVASGESDSRGLVHVCRAPRHVLFVIAAEKDGAAGSASVTATNPLTTVRVRLAPP
jgi:hypothetical protein